MTRVAHAGVGGWGKNVVRVIGELTDLAWVIDTDEGRRAEYAARYPQATVTASFADALADDTVDAVAIATPVPTHYALAKQALEAGKHVLCEKPIGLDAADAERLAYAAAGHPTLKVMEAFMYRHHPQWQKACEIVRGGGIGQLRAIHTAFSYFNVDGSNIRNQRDAGGGGLMDIGCYAISLSRLVFADEPHRVVATATVDPVFGTDSLASALLEFRGGPALFTCSTQLVPYQRVQIFGTDGRVELEIPFNAPPDAAHYLWHQRGSDITTEDVGRHDQYLIQGDLFSRAILDNTPVPTPLSDAVANMRVIDRIFKSVHTGRWE